MVARNGKTNTMQYTFAYRLVSWRPEVWDTSRKRFATPALAAQAAADWMVINLENDNLDLLVRLVIISAQETS